MDEKTARSSETDLPAVHVESPDKGDGPLEEPARKSWFGTIVNKLVLSGVEMRSLDPVPVEQRTHTKYYNILTLFGGSFMSLLPISIGTTPTLVFGLSFRDAAIMIPTMQLILICPTLYILTLAPQLGMRQSVQLRYAFGRYPIALVSVIIIIMTGIFGILASVGGAECLWAVRPGTLPIEAGVGIIFIGAFIIGFIGYGCLHFVCQYIWIPNIIVLIVLVCCAGPHLKHQAPAAVTGARPFLATISICASNMITWGVLVGDYACYMPPKAPRLRLALYCLMGLYVPFSLLMILGAAIGGAIPAIPSWTIAYQQGSFGGVLGEILTSRVGGFGRFCLVILGFSIVTTSARDMYSISLYLASIIPRLHRVPRVLVLIATAGAMTGIGIAASSSFLPSLSTLVSIAGYMTGPIVGCFLVEYLVFRKADPTSMDPAIWNNPKALPTGIPALISTLVPWALIVPSMDTVWYSGPIAKVVGDLAWELGTASAVVLYLPLRAMEISFRGRL